MEKCLPKVAVCGKLRVEGKRAVCPVCGRRTAQRIEPETRVESFPLFCKFCKAVSIVSGP